MHDIHDDVNGASAYPGQRTVGMLKLDRHQIAIVGR
jgi:hypothetical protein